MHLLIGRGHRTAIIPALAAGLAVALMPATPAAAASTGTVTRSGGTVTFVPLSGAANRVTFYVAGDLTHLRVSDPAGITAGAGCTQTSATTATCGTIAAITGIHADGGDGDDRLSAEHLNIPATFDGGPGQDILVGGTADDHLSDPDGWPAHPIRATFRGGAGNDTIISRNGGYDRVECEGGLNDTVTADLANLDRVTNTCETINRG
ncbi:hypothetical protein [Streptomyces sp. NPDC001401]|uniref:hypothetical protein n=1 Tax=Streptomyces sp. NPDC001401 TaxID=3364570 RepID=UPI003688692B